MEESSDSSSLTDEGGIAEGLFAGTNTNIQLPATGTPDTFRQSISQGFNA